MSIKITQTFSDYKRKTGKPLDIRVSKNPSVESLSQSIQNIITDNQDIRKEQNGLIEHISTFASLLNGMKEDIQKSSVSDSQINSISKKLNLQSGSSNGKTIIQVTKQLYAGTVYNEIFQAPSILLTLPVAFIVVDGMGSPQTLVPTNLTVSSFTISVLQDSLVIYSYQYL